MQFAGKAFAIVLLFGLGSGTMAEIYESHDAQGNPVFSDNPATGSTRIDIPHTNVGDAVKVSKPPPSAKQVPDADKSSASSQTVTWQERARLDEEEERRHKRELIGDDPRSEQRHEVGDENDVHRHEVGNHLVEHRHERGGDAHDHTLDGFEGQGEVIQRHVIVHRAVHHR